MGKRGNEHSQLSKEEYEAQQALQDEAGDDHPGYGMQRASEGEMKRRRIVRVDRDKPVEQTDDEPSSNPFANLKVPVPSTKPKFSFSSLTQKPKSTVTTVAPAAAAVPATTGNTAFNFSSIPKNSPNQASFTTNSSGTSAAKPTLSFNNAPKDSPKLAFASSPFGTSTAKPVFNVGGIPKGSTGANLPVVPAAKSTSKSNTTTAKKTDTTTTSDSKYSKRARDMEKAFETAINQVKDDTTLTHNLRPWLKDYFKYAALQVTDYAKQHGKSASQENSTVNTDEVPAEDNSTSTTTTAGPAAPSQTKTTFCSFNFGTAAAPATITGFASASKPPAPAPSPSTGFQFAAPTPAAAPAALSFASGTTSFASGSSAPASFNFVGGNASFAGTANKAANPSAPPMFGASNNTQAANETAEALANNTEEGDVDDGGIKEVKDEGWEDLVRVDTARITNVITKQVQATGVTRLQRSEKNRDQCRILTRSDAGIVLFNASFQAKGPFKEGAASKRNGNVILMCVENAEKGAEAFFLTSRFENHAKIMEALKKLEA